jgi:hypothetical protein
MRTCLRSGGRTIGGIKGYPHERLHEEVAFLAYHFHWDHDVLMNLEHRDRQRWCEEVSKINSKWNSNEKAVSLQEV